MRFRYLAALALSFAIHTAAAADAAEKLVLEPYPGDTPWQEVTNQSNGNQWLREQIPADQKIEAYKDILTAQSFPQQKNVDPTTFLKNLFAGVTTACERVKVNGPKAQEENGVPVAYAQIFCNRQKGTDFGVNMFFKVIQGSEALYVVQREFRVPPAEAPGMMAFEKAEQAMALMRNMSVANGYLIKSAYLCGPQSTNKRCATP
ncbi:MAG: hypothetical protein QM803_20620 [Rhodocyclaceae bacterium]